MRYYHYFKGRKLNWNEKIFRLLKWPRECMQTWTTRALNNEELMYDNTRGHRDGYAIAMVISTPHCWGSGTQKNI